MTHTARMVVEKRDIGKPPHTSKVYLCPVNTSLSEYMSPVGRTQGRCVA